MTEHYDLKNLQLLPGNHPQPKPFFKSHAEYEEWRLRFIKEMAPALEEQRNAAAESMKLSLDHLIDT